MKRVIGILFLLAISGIFVSAGTHSASEIMINADGTDMSLQDAIDIYGLSPSFIYTPSTAGSSYHDLSKIWINAGTGKKTLINALSNHNFNTAITTTIDSIQYHTASEILLSNGKTLQQAIDDKSVGCVLDRNQICDISLCKKGTIQCDGTCGGTPINKNDGVTCGIGEFCFAGTCGCNPDEGNRCNVNKCVTGFTQCDGTCGGNLINNPRGIPCEGSKTCDGSGNCIGWSGTGCGSCPWGTTGKLCDNSAYENCYTSICAIPQGNWKISQLDYFVSYYSVINGVHAASRYPGPGYFTCAEIKCSDKDSYGNCHSWSTTARPWSIKPKI